MQIFKILTGITNTLFRTKTWKN